MQAMLSLAAIHLTVTSPSPLNSEALIYRGHAIKGLNTALSTPPKCKADSDAMLATCYILCGVTMYMGDSVEELFTMTRGIKLILRQDWRLIYGTSFENLSMDGQDGIIMPRLQKLPLLPEYLVAEARESIMLLRGLDMETGSVEEKVYSIQAEMVRLLSVSSLEGQAPPPFPIPSHRLIS
jgi:hypothetical protein